MLLGGLLTDLLGWRWILFINVPIGLVVALIAQRLIAEGRNPARTRSFDLLGALSATLGLSILVLGIIRTDVTGWGAPSTLALVGAGVLLLLAFLAIEGRLAKAPLMPLRIYASRTLSAANVVVLLVGGATFGMWFFVSLYLQQVLGYSPIKAGLAFLPMTLLIVIGSTVASRAVTRIGAKPLLVAGMIAQTAGLLLFAEVSVNGGYLSDVLAPRCWSRSGSDSPSCRRRSARSPAWPRARPDSPPAWSTPRGSWAGPSGWRSWPRWPPRTPTERCIIAPAARRPPAPAVRTRLRAACMRFTPR